MSPEEAYQFIDTDRSKATIYGVLRHVGLTPRDHDFEDCAQEAWIAFYLWLCEDLAATLDDNALRKIAYTRMYRHILNIRYRVRRQQYHHVMTEDATLASFGSANETDVQLELHGIPLTSRQREIIWYMLASSGNQSWVAAEMQLSRRTISREVQVLRDLLEQHDVRTTLHEDIA